MMRNALLVIIVFSGIAGLVLIDDWQTSHWQMEKAMELELATRLCSLQVENAIKNRLDAIEALSALFMLHPETRADEFARFAAALMQFNPPIRALQYADPQTRVTYVYPSRGNEVTVQKPMLLIADPKRGPYVKKAIHGRRPVLQGPFELRQGGTGIVLRSPIFRGDGLAGLAIGVFDLSAVINEAIVGLDTDRFGIHLRDSEGNPVFSTTSSHGETTTLPISIADVHWTIGCSLKRSEGSPPWSSRLFVWICGLGFVLMTALLVRSARAQALRLESAVEERTKELVKANASLENEVAERLRAEGKLLQRETEYRLLVENQNDLIMKFDSGQIISYASPSYCRAFGVDERNILGRSFLPLVHKDDVDIVKQSLASLTEKPHTTYHEERAKTVNGWRWFGWSLSAMVEDTGDILEVIAVGRDITERRIAEDKLRLSEEKFQKAFLHAPLLMTISAIEEGTYLEVNEAFVEKTGYQRDVAVGHSSVDIGFISTENRDHLARQLQGGGRIKDLELELSRADGSGMICLYSGEIIRVDGKKRLLSIAADITSRKVAEKALAEREKKYRALFEESNDGIILHDLEGHIFETNVKIESLLGYEKAEFLKLSIQDLHPASELKDSKQAFLQTGQQGHAKFETRFLHKKGTTIEVEISSSLIDTSKQIVQGIVRDITDRKQIEMRLQQAQKMESIGNLAGGIAHDFNNILFPIVGMSEMLIEDLPEGSLESENAGEILKAGRRGSDLVKQILAFSRQTEHKKMPVKPQQVLKEVVKLSRATIPSSIKITQHLQGDCGFIYADPTQLHQVAMNLVTNAYHAVEQIGGEISIELRETGYQGDASPGIGDAAARYAMLGVSDNGCGIDATILSKIFEPYFTTKAQGKGTGLGLAVVYGIVKEHGGDIKVYSEAGEGTAFRVFFPLYEKEVEPALRDSSPRLCGTESILLVDDEKAVVLLEKQMLERLGYEIHCRTSSLEALELFKAKPDAFDLVISDMTMPEMSGYQLAKELLCVNPSLPVLLCTGFSDMLSEEKTRNIGVKGVLMKPIVTTEMAGMVRRILDTVDIPPKK